MLRMKGQDGNLSIHGGSSPKMLAMFE